MTDTLYYDGQCPLCVKEMDRLARIKDDSLVLKNIHSLTDRGREAESDEKLPDRDELLRVLHLERNGQMIKGIEANIAAWEHTRFGWLWRSLRWPLIRPVAAWLYNHWARWRYDRLYAK